MKKIELIHSFPNFSKKGKQSESIISLNDNAQEKSALIINVFLKSPNTTLEPMEIFDSVNRSYKKLFQYNFGKGKMSHQHAMFYLNGVESFKNLHITVKHSSSNRRMITVDQFTNIKHKKLSSHQSLSQGVVQITSGLVQAKSNELIYGSIALGHEFDNFKEPDNFTSIQNIKNNIDNTVIKTYYQFTTTNGQYGVSALVSDSSNELGNFIWSAATQTFRSVE